MPLTTEQAADLAEAYLAAARDAAPIAPIRERFPELSEEEAYTVQAELVRRRLADGAGLAGYKAGATNAGAQANFGLSQAVYGVLFDDGAVAADAAIDVAALIHPRLECEVAFRMGAELRGPGVTVAEALAAVDGVLAAFEIVDARTAGWAAKMPEMIADNVFQARYVLAGTALPAAGLDLAAITVTLLKNGAVAAQASGANVLGSPANALAWLANRLADHGQRIPAGAVVLAGSLTPLVPVAPGDSCEAVFDHLGTLRVAFV